MKCLWKSKRRCEITGRECYINRNECRNEITLGRDKDTSIGFNE